LEQAALDAMVSNGDVTVDPECLDNLCESAMADAGEWIEFIPADTAPTVAFVFYPGGGVDARAYAPPAQEIAKSGVLTILVPMPGKFALNGYDRVTDVMSDHPEIARWYLGGHSLGGVTATQYEGESPGNVAGLILWAAYGSVEYDMADLNTPVAVIHGTKDGLATVQDVEAGKPYLPESTEYHRLEGANHAQFGYYGEQAGDGEATITKEEQQELVVELTLEAIE
jgi:surfactin synthase thioesterase subunit